MKKKVFLSKLNLKKELISNLNKQNMQNVYGGVSVGVCQPQITDSCTPCPSVIGCMEETDMSCPLRTITCETLEQPCDPPQLTDYCL